MKHQAEPHLHWGSASFASELTALRERVAQARASAVSRSDLLLVEDLATAYEELRVADAELRAQQEHIVGLLRDRQDVTRQQERAAALVPVPVVSTDLSGVVRTVNAAAAMLFGAAASRLVGKPLAV